MMKRPSEQRIMMAMHLLLVAIVAYYAFDKRAEKSVPPTQVNLPSDKNFQPLIPDSTPTAPEQKQVVEKIKLDTHHLLTMIQATDTKPGSVEFSTDGSTDYNLTFPPRDEIRLLAPEGRYTVRLSNSRAPFVILELKEGEKRTEYLTFKLTKHVKLANSMWSDSQPLSLEFKNGTARLTAVEEDLYEDWGARGVCPHIKVVWDWNGRTFVYNGKEMKDPSQSHKNLNGLKLAINEGFRNDQSNANEPIELAPPELAEETLNLLYAGDAVAARRFYDSCWPKHRQGKRTYWSFVMTEARKSKLWPAVRAVNDYKT